MFVLMLLFLGVLLGLVGMLYVPKLLVGAPVEGPRRLEAGSIPPELKAEIDDWAADEVLLSSEEDASTPDWLGITPQAHRERARELGAEYQRLGLSPRLLGQSHPLRAYLPPPTSQGRLPRAPEGGSGESGRTSICARCGGPGSGWWKGRLFCEGCLGREMRG